ncbi:MAG: LytR/AlgR family response regulator transcription factor [Flammeovirgaceae bacterium]
MSKLVKVVIVDDEHYAREVVRHLLERDATISILAECANGYEAVEAIVKLKPDLVFLDIQMPEMDGFQVIKQVEHFCRPYYIFATAYDSFALQAFDVNALDYLLKPFDDERFYRALHKAKAQIFQQGVDEIGEKLSGLIEYAQANSKSVGQYLSRIPIKEKGRIRFIQTAYIDWVEAADQYVQIHVGPEKHVIRESMNTLETQLDPKLFFRIHRSSIVNLNRIQELQPYFKGDYMVILQDGTQLKLTRTRKEAFQRAFGIELS